jgi:hypothetical protein
MSAIIEVVVCYCFYIDDITKVFPCRGAFAAPEHVYSTEACAAPGGVYTTGA